MDNIHQHAHRHLHHARTQTTPDVPKVMPQRPVEPTMDLPTRTLFERTTRALMPRDTCTGAANLCEKPESSNTTPIVLAAVIPIVVAIIVLIFLHRRHTKKLKQEDIDDKHKSLDFGMEPSGGVKNGRKIPEMSVTDAEKSIRRGRGLSMDMDVGSPYILPAGLNGSRESFHSMSRSMNDPHDPYRPVTFIQGDSNSMRGSSMRHYPRDGASTHTGSSGGTDRMNANLLRNAQRMSQSYPPRGESISLSPTSPQDRKMPEIQFPEPTAAPRMRSPSPLGPANGTGSPPPNRGLAPLPLDAGRDSYLENNAKDLRKSNDYLGSFIHSRDPSAIDGTQEKAAHEPTLSALEKPKPASPEIPPTLPRMQSQQAVVQNANTSSFMSDSSYGDGFKVTPPSPTHAPDTNRKSLEAPIPVKEEDPYRPVGLGVEDIGYDPRRLSMSVRPLPADDPNEDPEQRANRIRSFYKEYFDDSKPDPSGGAYGYGDYYEDYDSEYLADGAVFDPATGQFVVAQAPAPFAQPVTRRAMTPPPRAPPRFQGAAGGRGRNFSQSSGSRFMPPPRGMSSMSGRLPAPGPRKPLLPPAPLTSLPTPHRLKEDSAIFNPLDFAPPVSIRERQNGMRPDSPLGSPRPYSPSIRPHTPLAGAFDELAVMPSAHALRKSGTFTALDFAPPPRFRDGGSGMSDAGSIRSNRSGMSQVAMQSVRAGAYRVSRIPKEVVNTKENMFDNLKPQMNMIAPA